MSYIYSLVMCKFGFINKKLHKIQYELLGINFDTIFNNAKLVVILSTLKHLIYLHYLLMSKRIALQIFEMTSIVFWKNAIIDVHLVSQDIW